VDCSAFAESLNPAGRTCHMPEHPELRELCQRIAPRQKAKVKNLKQWRCEWFKDCD